MTSFRQKHIRQGKTTFMGGDVGDSSTRGVKEGPSEGQPQWKQWEWHKDEGGGKHSSSIEGTTKAIVEGHFKGEMFLITG